MKKIIILFITILLIGALALGFGCLFRQKAVITADLQVENASTPLAVQGALPTWLAGTLIRNGPVNVTVNGKSNAHWFDGPAMLHAFSFEQNTVKYTNKFLRTTAYHTVFEEESLEYSGFAADPCRSLFKRFFTRFKESVPNANVNIAKLADEFVALTETPLPVRFDPKTLDTLGVLNYDDALPQEKCWESAHPHVSEKEIVNYLIQYGPTSYYTLYHLVGNTREIITQITVEEPAYMHSFALTENYVVLTEFPFVVQPLDLLTKGRPFIQNFSWKPERNTQFTVVDRHSGKVVGKYQTKPFFSFHHANAYEQENKLIIDCVGYDDASVVLLQEDQTYPRRLERYTLSLKTDLITVETVLEAPIEFPRINEAFDGKAYTYVYLASPSHGGLYKVNMETKKSLEWLEEGCYAGEPVFVPSPSALSEDDGVVMTIVQSDRHAFLLILDAQSFKEIARAYAPNPIPSGLHAQFFHAVNNSLFKKANYIR